MSKYLLRRFLFAVIILIFGSLIIYTAIRFLPTSFIETTARQRSALPGAKPYNEILAELNKLYARDTSILDGFFKWFRNAMRGDWGTSWVFNKPVLAKFREVIWYSVFLNVVTLFVQTFISIPLGITAARNQYGKTDYFVTVFSLACISLPTFFLATVLKFIFSIKLGWFDLYGAVGRYHMQLSEFRKFLDLSHHMVLPVITLSMLSIGGMMRFTRTNMLEVLNADYIRTAQAKGLPEDVVIRKHAFRNTLIPLVTYMSYLIPNLFAGSLITETLFQIPGIGFASYTAVTQGDIPFAMFYSFLSIALTQVSLLIADFMYAVVDPRVRIN